MTLGRFPATEPGLADLVGAASDDILREAIGHAVRTAVRESGIDNQAVVDGLGLLSAASYGESPQRNSLESVWRTLDQQAWILAEAESPEYPQVFGKARAVNALWYALDSEPRIAGEGAIYEALHSVDDSASLRNTLIRILSHTDANTM